jgi:hypothetical protein
MADKHELIESLPATVLEVFYLWITWKIMQHIDLLLIWIKFTNTRVNDLKARK